jgi:hypothetical protein
MPDQVIDIPGVGVTSFPDSMTEAQVNAAATRLYQQANPGKKQPPQSNWGATAMQGASALIQPVANAAAEVATNPNVPKMAATIGRTIGAVAPPVAGAIEAGPVGFLAGTAAAAKGAWAGGKTGWFTGKLAQNVAAPIADIMEKAVPYAQAVSTLAGAQGVNDLAQMADPKREDIGTLGVGGSGQASTQAAMMGAQIRALTSQGMAPSEAARTVSNAWAKFLHEQQTTK